MKRRIIALIAIITGVILFFFSLSFADFFKEKNSEIVVSIKPLHSLVCALTKNIAHPILLLDGYFSPHHVQLTPSQVQAIKNAKLFIWIGPAYEQSLYTHVMALKEKVLTIQDSSLIQLKPLRNGRFWDKESCCHYDDEHHHNHEHDEAEDYIQDGHIWLDPLTMMKVVDVVLQYLKSLYPAYQTVLEKNAKAYQKRLRTLHQDLLKQMEPYKGQTYIIQHDGNQYFDNAFGVQTIATISIDPNIPVSAGHLIKIRNAISNGKIHPKCLYAERQIDSTLAKNYANTLKLSFAILDYLGVDIPAGDGAYEGLMRVYVNEFIEGIIGKK